MNLNLRPTFLYALLVIGACGFPDRLRAQPSRLARIAVGQVVDEVLNVLVSPDSSLSRVPVAKRKLFLDHARTMVAFGHPGESKIPMSDPRLRAIMKSGSRSLLGDCDQLGVKQCRELGWGVYVWVEPLSVTTSQALVLVHASWAERGSTAFEEGVAPQGRAILVGFAANVYLTRTQNGRWKFEKLGSALVGD